MFNIQSFLVFFIFLAGFEQIYETFVLGPRKEKGELKGEKWTILWMGIIHGTMFFLTLGEFYLLQRHLDLRISSIGLVFYFLGFFFRYWSIYTLGKLWSIHIEIRSGHKLIKDGPYKLMRHPAYLALFLKVPSVPLILNSYFTFLFVVLTYCPLVFIRLYSEEIELFKKFKKPYVKFRKEKWALFPFSKGNIIKSLGKKVKYLKKVIQRW